jgi:hypothetical protein
MQLSVPRRFWQISVCSTQRGSPPLTPPSRQLWRHRVRTFVKPWVYPGPFKAQALCGTWRKSASSCRNVQNLTQKTQKHMLVHAFLSKYYQNYGLRVPIGWTNNKNFCQYHLNSFFFITALFCIALIVRTCPHFTTHYQVIIKIKWKYY